MARLVTAGLFMSLDGVVDADGEWQYPWFDAELFEIVSAGTGAAGSVLMGRVSAQGYAALRDEHPDSPMLSFLDGVERHVVSSTITGDTWEVWPGTRVVHPDDLVSEVTALREGVGAGVQVAGSPTVVRALLAADLLDELLVLLLPVVVGGGHRFFPESADGTGPQGLHLHLREGRALASGAMALRYGRA